MKGRARHKKAKKPVRDDGSADVRRWTTKRRSNDG